MAYDKNYGFKHQGRPIKAVADGEGHRWRTNENWVIFYIMGWKDPVLEVKKLLGNPAYCSLAHVYVLGDFYNWIKGEGGFEKPWRFKNLYLNDEESKEFKDHVIKEYIKKRKEQYV